MYVRYYVHVHAQAFKIYRYPAKVGSLMDGKPSWSHILLLRFFAHHAKNIQIILQNFGFVEILEITGCAVDPHPTTVNVDALLQTTARCAGLVCVHLNQFGRVPQIRHELFFDFFSFNRHDQSGKFIEFNQAVPIGVQFFENSAQ